MPWHRGLTVTTAQQGKGLDIISGASDRPGNSKEEGEEEEAEDAGGGNGRRPAADSGESSDDEEDDSEDEGDAKKDLKKSAKAFTEADKADKRAVRKGSRAAAVARAAQDATVVQDAMEEDEDGAASGSITLVKATRRDLEKLGAVKDRYHVTTKFKQEGASGRGTFEMRLRHVELL